MAFSPAYPDRPALSAAYPDADTLGPAYPTNAFTDLWRAQFVSAASQLIKMTAADFGAFDRQQFTISQTANFDSLGTIPTLFRQGLTSGNQSFYWRLNSFNKIEIGTSANGITFDGFLITTAIYTADTDHALQFDYESANSIAGDRIRLYDGGVRITAFDTEIYPALNSSVFNSAHDIEIGGATGKTQFVNGKLNNCAFVSGNNPAPSAFNVGGVAQDLTGLSGLWSWLSFESATNPWLDLTIGKLWTLVNAPTRVSNP